MSTAHRPAITGLVMRPFHGDADFPAMACVANASFAADGIEIRRTPEAMAHDYRLFTECDPFQDVRMVEVHGELAAYARVWRWTQADGLMLHGQLGFVHPRWRRRGIGMQLQQWVEQRHREVAALQPGHPHQHHVFLQPGEVARTALFEASGYRPRRYMFEMLHPALHHAPGFRLPEGVEMRPVQPEHYRAIWDSHMDALQDHWGFSPPVEGDYASWQRQKTFQPHRWQIAWDIATNRVVGQVKTWIDAEQNAAFGRQRGFTEFISVARPWRRRGIARALVAQSLRTLAAAGMTESMLGVDSENPTGAVQLYEDCGFRVVKRNVIYRKGLALEAG